MKNLLIVILLIMSSCNGKYRYEGNLHESNPKLHNIQVIDMYQVCEGTFKLDYYDLKDSAYHRCRIDEIFTDTFKISGIRK